MRGSGRSIIENGDQDMVAEEVAANKELRVPSVIPVLPTKDVVLYPYLLVPLVISEERLVKLTDDALASDKTIGIFAQKNVETDDPGPEDLYGVGTAAVIVKMLRFPDGTLRILVQGFSRIKATGYTQTEPYLRAEVESVPDEHKKTDVTEALVRNVLTLFEQIVSLAPYLPEELQGVAMNLDDPSKLADLIASNINIEMSDRQALLETFDPQQRLTNLIPLLTKELNILELGDRIRSQVKTEIDKDQREYYLREQMKAIQRELGEEDERTVEINDIREKIEAAQMPEEVRKVAEHELDRLARMPVAAAEYTVSRTYLDWLITLPWKEETKDNLDVAAARAVLDEDHYDLDKVKERILEHLAVRRLRPQAKGPILCFVGPPGVGKTSLGRSIARALGREFVRLSLGGVRDEAEIRGHRRTYVGSLPGRIIQRIRDAGSKNPVYMLDEIDKIGQDFRGDPAAALLEVLDPEQNHAFSDHYLDVPFDLSKVMFITTANLLDPVPPVLRDRMEVLELPGYIEEEKVEIARRYLVPRQIRENGLTEELISFTDEAIIAIIRDYTREAGLRNLEREIASICRKVAKGVAEGRTDPIVVLPGHLSTYLGPAKVTREVAEGQGEVGIAAGLAWTPNGGEILFIEATKMKGRHELILTGQLGEVMRESAQAALSLLRARADRLGIDPSFYEDADIHIHVPSGATPKDGPSAGVAIAAALASLLTKRAVRPDIAMTGEITLRGKVLPIGGVKEKVLAAKRAGMKRVLLPRRNESDLEEVPEKVKADMDFVLVETVDEVLASALEDGAPVEE
jgi:ATP-dependent Lon protease